MIRKKSLTRFIPMFISIMFIAGVTGGVVLGIQSLLEKPPQSKKFVQQISLIKPPPPPKIEKPPEPEVEEVKIKEPESTPDEMPEAMDDLPPMGDQLGLDADGAAGGDAFGLLGKKGGRSLLGGGPGDAFSWYTGRLSSYIEEKIYDLSEQEKFRTLRDARYTVNIKVWIEDDLTLRGRLISSTGDQQRDQAIRQVLASLGTFNERAPQDMEQPVRLAIKSRL
jgi:protein TonB